MSTQHIDAEIVRLREAAETIAANLGELQRDPTFELVATASVQGVTAERWMEAQAELDRVEVWFARLIAFVDEVTNRRGTGLELAPEREREVDVFLSGPSIELTRDEVPLAERSLLGAAHEATHCTADELLGHMADAFDAAKSVILAVGTAWDSLVPRLRDVRDLWTRLDGQRSLAPVDRDRLDGLRSELDRIAEDLVLDPLVVAPDDLDALEGRVAAIDAELAAVDELRTEAADHLLQADALYGQLRSAVADADAAHREAIEKIAAPGVPSPRPVGDALAAGLGRVKAMVADGRWRDAEGALRAWTADVDQQLRDALECAAANRAPIELRNQLRGRLDAYRAMAIGKGLVEDVQLAALHARARDALYTAPTDLADAEALVQAYREALPRDPADRKAVT
jgi:hypothetical protein